MFSGDSPHYSENKGSGDENLPPPRNAHSQRQLQSIARFDSILYFSIFTSRKFRVSEEFFRE